MGCNKIIKIKVQELKKIGKKAITARLFGKIKVGKS